MTIKRNQNTKEKMKRLQSSPNRTFNSNGSMVSLFTFSVHDSDIVSFDLDAEMISSEELNCMDSDLDHSYIPGQCEVKKCIFGLAP